MSFNFQFTHFALVPIMPSPLSIGLTVALSATSLLAHPLFNGELIARAEDLLPEYDYVVVGAGASGLTVANRLSEDQSKSLS